MKEQIEMIKEFDEAFGLDEMEFMSSSEERDELLLGLILEEAEELQDAMSSLHSAYVAGDDYIGRRSMGEVLDAIGDLLYVVVGFAVRQQLPIEEIFNRVHESNMSKLGADGPIYRADGKLLKGPNFEEPYFEDILDEFWELV